MRAADLLVVFALAGRAAARSLAGAALAEPALEAASLADVQSDETGVPSPEVQTQALESDEAGIPPEVQT